MPTIQLLRHDFSIVYFKCEYREDISKLFDSIQGYAMRGGSDMHSIPIGEWKRFKNEAFKLPGVTLSIPPEVEREMFDYLYSPPYHISLAKNSIRVKVKRGHYSGFLKNIPGCDYDYNVDDASVMLVPKVEGWRLRALFETNNLLDKVIWDKAAQVLVFEQAAKRVELDALATKKDVALEIPGMLLPPRDFQRVAVKFFEMNGVRGIDADEMGLGKTPTAIGTALYMNYNNVLVIVPASLKTNWVREIIKFTGIAPITFVGSDPTNYDGLNQQAQFMLSRARKNHRFTIINYDILNEKWVSILNQFQFDLIILDEAHYIKNEKAQRTHQVVALKAPHWLFLTGTPVLNRPQEMGPVMHILDPVQFPHLNTVLKVYTDGKRLKHPKKWQEALKPYMIRRLKKDVITELPPLNRITKYVDLEPRFREVYERVMMGVFSVIDAWNPQEAGADKAIANILVQIQRAKQIAALGKTEATADLATGIMDSTQPGERDNKVLIFTQWKATCADIARRLGHEALSFVKYNRGWITLGDKDRDDLVQQFQNDPKIKYLVVTEKTAKEGHNITAAMAVIFNDIFWTPAGHQQAEGRAYMRTSDPHGIDSYYQVAANTMDEWCMQLIAEKLEIIDETVDGVQRARVDESIAKDLITRIKEGMWSQR